MKRFSKKMIRNMAFFMVLMILITCFNPVQTFAAVTKPSFPDVIDLMDCESDYGYQIGNFGDKLTIKNMKSSNKSVVTASAVKEGTLTYIDFKIKKAGSSVLTFKVKIGNKTFSYKTKVNVRKYTNPLKTCKIGSRNFIPTFNMYNSCEVGKKMSGKFKLALKSGWKLVSIQTYNSETGGNFKSYIKVPSKITLKKNELLKITVRNTKAKYEMDLQILA